jgi:hypothetical protein
MGVCPENQIAYPFITQKKDPLPNQLTKGHTHLFLMNQEGEIEQDEFDPGEEALEDIFRGPVPEETRIEALMAIPII